MPEWNPRANDIFAQAAEIDPPADRRLFVEQQCGVDVALQAQVESLLAAGLPHYETCMGSWVTAMSRVNGEPCES